MWFTITQNWKSLSDLKLFDIYKNILTLSLMNITTTKAATTITFTTSLKEMRGILEDYQRDLMADLLADEYGAETMTRAQVATFGLTCATPHLFDTLIEKHGCHYIATPKNLSGWVMLFIDQPYIFGLTEEIAEDGDVVLLVIEGHPVPYDVRRALKNI